jgi:hypothetical protein
MESTSSKGDKGKRPTKASASARRAKATENPMKKRPQKRAAEDEFKDAESIGPEPQPGATEAAQVACEHDATEGVVRGDDIVRELEEEEELRGSDVDTGNVQISAPNFGGSLQRVGCAECSGMENSIYNDEVVIDVYLSRKGERKISQKTLIYMVKESWRVRELVTRREGISTPRINRTRWEPFRWFMFVCAVSN